MSWYLAPALVDLRAELDALAPDRDRRSDGTIGDAAHQATDSKHNPNAAGVVRAFDGDKTGPWPAGITFDRIVATVVDRHRRGLDDRLQNVIWNRHIWSRSWGWTQEPYDGPSAHTEHGHFEVRDSAAYWNKRGPFGLLELEDFMTDEDMRKLAGYIGDAVADRVLHADVIPYTSAAGVADTWQVATAVGYMTGKARQQVEQLGVIAENTAPPAPTV